MSGGWINEWPRWRRYRARTSAGEAVPYNVWVNLSPISNPDDLNPPAGLSVEEAVRIAEAITASHAQSTRTMYDWSWSQWECWGAARGTTAAISGCE